MRTEARSVGAIYYIDEAAAFDFIGDVSRCIITSGGEVFEFRSTASTAAQGARNYAAASAARERKADNVIPLCELCVRHDLPRHIE